MVYRWKICGLQVRNLWPIGEKLRREIKSNMIQKRKGGRGLDAAAENQHRSAIFSIDKHSTGDFSSNGDRYLLLSRIAWSISAPWLSFEGRQRSKLSWNSALPKIPGGCRKQICISGCKLEVCVCSKPEFVIVEGCEGAATLQSGGEATEPSLSKDLLNWAC